MDATPGKPRDTLHAHEITPADATLIRMMAGAHPKRQGNER